MLKAEIIGRIGADAEVKVFSGKKHVTFNVACNEYTRDDKDNIITTTTWVSVLWHGSGGKLLPYLKKGENVFVRGGLKVSVYTDLQGVPKVSVGVKANEVQLCGGKSDILQAYTLPPARKSKSNDGLPF